MTRFLFPDNTVLCNFASVDRLDLLCNVLRGRGRWTAAIAYEVTRSSQTLPALAGIADKGWLGEPIEIAKESEVERVNQIRRSVFGGVDERPLEHLGEAETCFVVKEWPEFAGSWWISDDREALRYARFQGITTRETIDLITNAVVDGDISPRSAYELMLRMADAGRGLRLPDAPSQLQG